jgi:hypothetical protein
MLHTPSFPAWAPRLAAWRSKLRSGPAAQPLLHQLALLFAPLLPAGDLQPEARQQCSRRRHWPKDLIFWTFLAQILFPRASCRWAVSQARAQAINQGFKVPSADTSPYCQARDRFKLEWIHKFIDRVRMILLQRVPDQLLWLGHSVKVLDATTVDVPDTAANQADFPQPPSQKPGLGFPLVRVSAMFCLASGALLGYVTGAYAQSELVLATKLLKHLRPRDVLLADRLYGCYRLIVQVMALRAQVVCRLHGSRKVDFRQARRLGKNDGLFVWKRPTHRPKGFTRKQWLALPDELTVRLVRYSLIVAGFRTRQVTLVTTLLDAKAYPPQALAQLYKRRWNIELSFAQIKTILQMESLSSLSPAMVHKELAMHLLAYQLIRVLMQEASLRWHSPLERLSFKGSLDALQHYSQAMLGARTKKKRAELYDDLLKRIASDQVPERPNRREPRALKRRLKNFQRLTAPRHQFTDTPHHSRVLSRRAKSRNVLLRLI